MSSKSSQFTVYAEKAGSAILRRAVDFSFQPRNNIDFSEWIALLTLCLAPLVLHIVAGVPTTTYFEHKRPQWHDQITLYNPTSIIWRYFVITDRRVRAKSWNAEDMAASNTLFWTAKGWDGSESIMRSSRVFLTRIPSRTRISFFSATSAKTLTITLQGVQAIYCLLVRPLDWGVAMAIDSIFFPLALLGLLRLPAAIWLTEDYSYADYNTDVKIPQVPASNRDSNVRQSEDRPFTQPKTLRAMGLLDASPSLLVKSEYAAQNWRGILVRVLFLLPLAGFALTSLCFTFPRSGVIFTVTALCLNLFYTVFLCASATILSAYIILGRSTTTIIPCITSCWYKVYTAFLGLLAFLLILAAALETKKTPCGKHTTLGKNSFVEVCGEKFFNASTTEGLFGVAEWVTVPMQVAKTRIELHKFDGWCSGKLDSAVFFSANITASTL